MQKNRRADMGSLFAGGVCLLCCDYLARSLEANIFGMR
jgi:hypothetical protein